MHIRLAYRSDRASHNPSASKPIRYETLGPRRVVIERSIFAILLSRSWICIRRHYVSAPMRCADLHFGVRGATDMAANVDRKTNDQPDDSTRNGRGVSDLNHRSPRCWWVRDHAQDQPDHGTNQSTNHRSRYDEPRQRWQGPEPPRCFSHVSSILPSSPQRDPPLRIVTSHVGVLGA